MPAHVALGMIIYMIDHEAASQNKEGACLAGDGLRFRSAELATVTLLRLEERLRSFFPSVSLPCSFTKHIAVIWPTAPLS